MIGISLLDIAMGGSRLSPVDPRSLLGRFSGAGGQQGGAPAAPQSGLLAAVSGGGGAPAPMPGGDAPPGLQPPGGPAPEQARAQMVRQSERAIRNMIATVGGNPSNEDVREAAEEMTDGGEGRPGRTFFSRLFLGEAMNGLTPEQNQKLTRAALLDAGLSILTAPAGASFSQVLALGILQARRSATETAGALLDEQNNQKIIGERRAVLGSNLSTVDQYQVLLDIASREGDTAQQKALTDIITGLRKDSEMADFKHITLANGSDGFLNPVTGAVVDLAGNPVQGAAAQGEAFTLGTGQVRFQQSPDGAVQEVARGPQAPAGGSGGGGGSGGDSLGSIPPGFQLIRGPDGQPVLIPIPGGPAARGIEDEGEADAVQMAQVRQNAVQQLDDLDGAIELAGSFGTTGAVSLATRAVPGTKADRLQKRLATVAANIALDTIVKLKQAGGTLGQVSNVELQLLQDAKGSLTQVQSAAELVRVLRRLRGIYAKVVAGSGSTSGGTSGTSGDVNEFDAMFGGGR